MQRRDERDPVARADPRPKPAAELPVGVVDQHQHARAHGFTSSHEEHMGLVGVGEGGGDGGDAGDGGRRGGRVEVFVAVVAAIVAAIVGIVVVFVAFPTRHRLDLQLLLLLAVEDGL